MIQALPPRDRGLYKFLYKRLRLPRQWVHGAMGHLRGRRYGDELALRQRLAAEIPDSPLSLEPGAAWRLFEPGMLAELDQLASDCADVFEQFQSSGEADRCLARNPNKRFLLGVVSGNEMLAYPQLIKGMLARPVLDAVTAYLGIVPRLEGAVLWWTPPNQSETSSQLWHIDELAQRQVKILLNCSDVDDQSGPLHFLPADRSDRIRKEFGHTRGRLDEQRLQAEIQPGEVLKATGGPGSGVIMDSSRCLHFGSRGNQRDRLLLAFHFFAPDSPVDSRYHIEAASLDESLADLDAHQRLALGIGLLNP